MREHTVSEAAAVRLVGWVRHDAGYIDNVVGERTFPTSGICMTNARNPSPGCEQSPARAKDNYNDVSVTWLPTLFGSLEWDIKSWLTGRVGCQQAMRMEKSGDNLDVNSADFLYGLGVGVHFNNFDVDATLNQNFPFTGGYFISGESTAGSMFGRVTADYHF